MLPVWDGACCRRAWASRLLSCGSSSSRRRALIRDIGRLGRKCGRWSADGVRLAFNDVEMTSRSAALVYKSGRCLRPFLTPSFFSPPSLVLFNRPYLFKKQTAYSYLRPVLTEYISTMRFSFASVALLALAHLLAPGVHGAPAVVAVRQTTGPLDGP